MLYRTLLSRQPMHVSCPGSCTTCPLTCNPAAVSWTHEAQGGEPLLSTRQTHTLSVVHSPIPITGEGHGTYNRNFVISASPSMALRMRQAPIVAASSCGSSMRLRMLPARSGRRAARNGMQSGRSLCTGRRTIIMQSAMPEALPETPVFSVRIHHAVCTTHGVRTPSPGVPLTPPWPPCRSPPRTMQPPSAPSPTLCPWRLTWLPWPASPWRCSTPVCWRQQQQQAMWAAWWGAASQVSSRCKETQDSTPTAKPPTQCTCMQQQQQLVQAAGTHPPPPAGLGEPGKLSLTTDPVPMVAHECCCSCTASCQDPQQPVATIAVHSPAYTA